MSTMYDLVREATGVFSTRETTDAAIQELNDLLRGDNTEGVAFKLREIVKLAFDSGRSISMEELRRAQGAARITSQHVISPYSRADERPRIADRLRREVAHSAINATQVDHWYAVRLIEQIDIAETDLPFAGRNFTRLTATLDIVPLDGGTIKTEPT